MSRVAITIMAFAVYLFVLGVVFVVAPNTLLALFRIPETTEVWIRIVGMLTLLIGFYYSIAARNELIPIMRATVVARVAVLAFLAAFVFLGLGPPVLLLFGAIDCAAAFWTWPALRT